jgi:hypothetical protein
MRQKLVCIQPGEDTFEVVANAESDKDLRKVLAQLPPGEYTILTVTRPKVTVAEVPSRTRVDLGPATATRARGPRKG